MTGGDERFLGDSGAPVSFTVIQVGGIAMQRRKAYGPHSRHGFTLFPMALAAAANARIEAFLAQAVSNVAVV